MTQSKLERLWRSYANQSRSITLVRWLGYSLLLLSLLDIIAILVPPNFMNPVWEFKSIGALVERIPVPLIGLVMAFWGEQDFRRPAEKLFLKGLSWLTLILAVVLLALLPLCFVSSNRIYNSKIQEVDALKVQRLALVEQLETKLSQSNSVDEIQSLLNRALNNSSPVVFDAGQSLSTVKDQVPTILEPAKAEIERQARAAQTQVRSERPGLLKRTVKWSLGAVVGGVIFIRIWQVTRWARKKSYL